MSAKERRITIDTAWDEIEAQEGGASTILSTEGEPFPWQFPHTL